MALLFEMFWITGTSFTALTVTRTVTFAVPLRESAAVKVRFLWPKKSLSAETLRILFARMTVEIFAAGEAVQEIIWGSSSSSLTWAERLVASKNPSSLKVITNGVIVGL